MRNIIIAIGMFFFLSGCSPFNYYGGKSPIEIEQHENPEVWKQVYKTQATLWPLEKKVIELEKKVDETEKTANKMRDELATAKLLSIQANKNIESLQAVIQQLKSEAMRKEKTAADMIRPAETKQETQKVVTTRVAGEGKKAGPDINSTIINDIKYNKVDTQDQVLIYVTAMNNPQLQTLGGATPRIVLDFFNTRNAGKEQYEILADGNFIKRIRVRSYQELRRKVRVVFDMMPNKKYSLERKFSIKENIYSFNLKAN